MPCHFTGNFVQLLNSYESGLSPQPALKKMDLFTTPKLYMYDSKLSPRNTRPKATEV